MGKEAQWQTLPWPQARKRRQEASQQKEEKVRKNIGKNGGVISMEAWVI